ATFERGDAFFEGCDRRIRYPRIDIAECLQVEQARGVIGAVEHERCRLINRQRACAGGRVRNLPSMQAQCVKAVEVIGGQWTPTLTAVRRAAGEGLRAAGIDGQCESTNEADCCRRNSPRKCKETEVDAALRRPEVIQRVVT